MGTLIQDLKYALRSFGRAKGFTIVVVLVMGLGIGVNTMMFSMVYGILFRPWPLPDVGRIVAVRMVEPRRGINNMGMSFLNYFDLREQAKSFSAFGGYWNLNAIVTIDRDPEPFEGCALTTGMLDALGVKPALGRDFTRDEETWSHSWTQVLISDRVWRKRFHADANVLGRAIRVNGRVRQIIGVMPPGFSYPENVDFWIPAGYDAATDMRTDGSLRGVARLKPGVSIEQADAELKRLFAPIAKPYPDLAGLQTRVVGLQENWRRNVRPMMVTMQLAVLFVLLIACANVANLMLARAAVRRREIALRLALGARRGRVVRQLLTESALLATFGAALGVVLAHWGQIGWMRLIPVELPFYINFTANTPVYAYTVLITAVAAIAAGLAPALHATDGQLAEALREGSAQSGDSRGSHRLRNALVVAEVALSLVLLVGAGLMIRTVQRLDQAGRSMRLEGLVTARVLLPIALYPKEADRIRFFRELDQRLRATPGISEVSAMSLTPLNNDDNSNMAMTPDTKDRRDAVLSNVAWVMPGALSTLGMPLERGREIDARDDEHAPRVAVVSASLAQKLWPGKPALGQRLRFAGEPDSIPWRTVVGVAADVVHNVEDLANSEGTKYGIWLSELQEPVQTLSWLVRSRGSETIAAEGLRAAVRGIDRDIAVRDVRSMREQLHFSLWVRRLFASLIGVFGAIALAIAAIGLYGVMAYSVARRTQEIGIRMALGADAAGVQRMVVGQALRLTVLGVGIGLVGAFMLTRFMSASIQDVSPTDPPTFTLVTVMLMFSGLIAAWVPSIRATRVDPMQALRAE
jgi:putative ABC transport system permease protein